MYAKYNLSNKTESLVFNWKSCSLHIEEITYKISEKLKSPALTKRTRLLSPDYLHRMVLRISREIEPEQILLFIRSAFRPGA